MRNSEDFLRSLYFFKLQLYLKANIHSKNKLPRGSMSYIDMCLHIHSCKASWFKLFLYPSINLSNYINLYGE
jgi:hypothetical protein